MCLFIWIHCPFIYPPIPCSSTTVWEWLWDYDIWMVNSAYWIVYMAHNTTLYRLCFCATWLITLKPPIKHTESWCIMWAICWRFSHDHFAVESIVTKQVRKKLYEQLAFINDRFVSDSMQVFLCLYFFMRETDEEIFQESWNQKLTLIILYYLFISKNIHQGHTIQNLLVGIFVWNSSSLFMYDCLHCWFLINHNKRAIDWPKKCQISNQYTGILTFQFLTSITHVSYTVLQCLYALWMY